MNRISMITIVVITLACHHISFGYSILPDSVYTKKHFIKKPKDIMLSPSQTITAFIIKNIYFTKNTITLEASHTFKKPKNMKNTFSDSDKLSLINILHSTSSMEGIKYYSHTRKKLRTLFEKSYVIQYPSMKRLKDPIIKDIKQTYSFYSLQKDKTFGEVIYRNTIYITPDFILLKTDNEDFIKYGMVPVVDKRKFKFFLFVVDKGEDIILYCIYSISLISEKAVPMQKISDSLFHRSDAIILWLYNKLM